MSNGIFARGAVNREAARMNRTYVHNGIRRRKSKLPVDPAVFLLSLTDDALIKWLEEQLRETDVKPVKIIERCIIESFKAGHLKEMFEPIKEQKQNDA